ncbi:MULTISPECIES: diaminobutyrate acetyltransferase [Actinomadura]|uniref:L-2,4-diaminobutyric acid acetyltransferase n=1 Tax=Actinomadura litoris TaxID=2678616 RepID=A0A7K1L4N1_9ACTN|nr:MULTISPECIES: diaminobutyrate acetyltransferase [Actinomadura]MBT2209940.1 diaminobutyrate acetyltransferase [Actinomadura sp. NEAU-AAG7]MUN39233.1 diaminobutyrate acetyltransferase [Actinomadura litoris]
MAAQPLESPTRRPERTETNADVQLQEPSLTDGPGLWRIANESHVLDVNSPYSYTLWCRDFADTSVVARDGSALCGFITGYVRPARPDTFFVWQVAVDESYRGRGLARRMLDQLAGRQVARGQRYLEATVTPDNAASTAMFSSFARDHGCDLDRSPLFGTEHFPGRGHEPEVLFRIGPLPGVN